ncbi:MAG TPA: GNAT family N-acetyltransferase [Thermoplasmata archaeon]
MAEDSTQAADASGPEYVVRRVTWRDIGAVSRAYRGQSPESRLFYHPFPFGSVRLGLLLAGFVVSKYFARRTIRLAPRESAQMMVARAQPGGELAGFGLVNFRWPAPGQLVARTGLFVAEAHRRRGMGGRLEGELTGIARSLGARRAEALIREGNSGSIEMYRSLGYRVGPSPYRDRKPPFEPFLLAVKELP